MVIGKLFFFPVAKATYMMEEVTTQQKNRGGGEVGNDRLEYRVLGRRQQGNLDKYRMEEMGYWHFSNTVILLLFAFSGD